MIITRPNFMQRFLDALNSITSENVQLVLGFVCALITGVARVALRQRRSSWTMRVAEGFMCAMLSTAFIKLGVYEFGLSYDYAPVFGVFTGFLGSEFISSVMIGIIKYKTFHKPDFNSKDHDASK